MKLRSQIIAVAVLLVATGAIFVMVGNAGVKTDFDRAPYWEAVASGEWRIADQPDANPQITTTTLTLDTFAATWGFPPPAADSDTPRQDAVAALANTLQTQIVMDEMRGPTDDVIDGAPVTWLHIRIDASVGTAGREIPRTEFVQVLFEKEQPPDAAADAAQQYVSVQYASQGEYIPAALDEFWVWLRDHIHTLAAPAEPELATWAEDEPGIYSYTPKPSAQAQLQVQDTTLDEFVTTWNLAPIPDDAELPLLTALESYRQSNQQAIADSGFTITPDTFDGPKLELYGGVPVALLRIQIESQPRPNGDMYQGVDLATALLDKGDGEIVTVDYTFNGKPDNTIYNDFLTWLEDNAADLVMDDDDALPTGDDAADDASDDAADDADAGDADDAADDAGDDAADDADAGDADDAADDASDDAADDADAGDADDAADDAGDDAADDADAGDADDAADDAGDDAADDADSDTAAAEGPWIERGEGQYLHAEYQGVQLTAQDMPLAQFVEGQAVEMPADDSDTPLLDVLDQTRVQFIDIAATENITMTDNAYVGPEYRQYGETDVAFLRIKVEAQSNAQGQPFPGLDFALVLIDKGDDEVTMIQFWSTQAPDTMVFADFESWLEDNADRLATR